MKRSGLVLGALSLAAVVAFVLHEAERPAPGPLHPTHAAVAELGTCESCHLEDTAWTDACGRCHADVSAEVTQRRGFHGSVGQSADACERCHVEHHGATAPLVGDAAFAAAGIASRDAFEHEADAGLSTGLHGRHDDLSCVECHANADAGVLAAGEQRFLGLTAACVRCHEDEHDGNFGARCEGCHGQSAPFATAAALDHSRFPLVNAHADVACASCHADGPPGDETGARGDVRACAACHTNPHATERLFIADANDCGRCHDTQSFALEFDAAAHAAAGTPLAGRHADAPCEGCHAPARMTAGMPTCGTCHEDVHVGAFPRRNADLIATLDAAPGLRPMWTASRRCDECHDERSFDAPRVTSADHGRFGNPLTSAHAAVACAACHTSAAEPAPAAACAACHASPHSTSFMADDECAVCHTVRDGAFAVAAAALEPARHTPLDLAAPHDLECSACHAPDGAFADRFPGRAARDCATCHGDPHDGAFDGGPFDSAACTECHAPDRFAPVAFTPELHARTALPLEGAHVAVDCAACHPGSGAARRFDGIATDCAGCHDDPHDGAFDRPGRPTVVDGRTGCARCHTTDGFRASVALGFDHGAWTGQVLVGAHARAGCGRCHDRKAGGALGAAPAACAACHDDPHRGQFRRAGKSDCARCHEERDSFTATRFDHDRDTRFRLDSDHARLPCESCHRPVVIAGGETVTLYRPLGTACRDCHATGVREKSEEPR